MVTFAIGEADLVIIPTQGSQLDAAEAVRAVKLVRNTGRKMPHPIPAAILFTRANAAIQTRDLKEIRAQFMADDVPILHTRLVERAAYRALFAYGGTLWTLDSTRFPAFPPPRRMPGNSPGKSSVCSRTCRRGSQPARPR